MSYLPPIFRIPAAIFLMLCFIWAAGLVGFAVHLRGTSVSNATYTDAIIVLTGGADRINKGLDLLSDNKARYLFISGVNKNVSAEQLVDLWRADAPELPCCIVLGHEAQNTYGNAAETMKWVEENDIKSARLLTTNYHMPRAWLEFKALMPALDLYAHPIESKKTGWALIASEYSKTIYTFVRIKFTSWLT